MKVKMKKTVVAKFGVTLFEGKTYEAVESIGNRFSVYPYSGSTTVSILIEAKNVEVVK